MKTYEYLYLDEFFLEWEMIQTKVVEKIKTQILCSITSHPRKSCSLWDNVGKHVPARQAKDDNKIWRMRTVYCITKATNTQNMQCLSFSTATMVTRTRLNATFTYNDSVLKENVPTPKSSGHPILQHVSIPHDVTATDIKWRLHSVCHRVIW